MEETVIYMAHDPLSNTEAQVTEFDPALLNAAAAQGVLFVAVDAHGNRRIADVSEVKPPKGTEGSLRLCSPSMLTSECKRLLTCSTRCKRSCFPKRRRLRWQTMTHRRRCATR